VSAGRNLLKVVEMQLQYGDTDRKGNRRPITLIAD
jgi:hypothetical protein